MMTAPPSLRPRVSPWWILLLVHFSMMAFALNLQMIPPLVPRLMGDLGLSHASVGLLMGLFTLPGIFLAIPGGRVSDALGPRGVALWSLALLSLGAVLMLPPHPGFLFAGRLCGGIGGAVLVVVAPQIIARTFSGPAMGLAMGVFNTGVPLGTVLAFNVLGYLSGRFGIPVVIMTGASFSFLCLTAFFLTYADNPAGNGAKAAATAEVREKLGLAIWLVSLLWALFNIAILAYFTYSIDFFAGAGIPEGTARLLGSLPMLLSIVLTPLAGLAMHRYGFRWSFTAAGCAISAGAIVLLLIPGRGMTVFWSIVIGVGISIVPPAVFTIAGEQVPASRTGTGYGILTTVFNLGVFLGIPLVGRVRDLTASYQASFLLMAAIMASAAALGAVSPLLVSKR